MRRRLLVWWRQISSGICPLRRIDRSCLVQGGDFELKVENCEVYLKSPRLDECDSSSKDQVDSSLLLYSSVGQISRGT